MAKRLVLLVLLLIHTFLLLAQDDIKLGRGSRISGNGTGKYINDSSAEQYHDVKPAVVKKPARDLIMLQLNYNNWVKKPDTVRTRTFGYGFNGYFCYDFPIKNSKLSFATGVGVSVSVTYLNQEVLANTDTLSSVAGAARFIADTTHYKRYKLVSTYLSAPFELRYFSNMNNRNKGFKAAIGMEIGTLLGADAKGLYSVDGTNVKMKIDTKRYYSPWDFAATVRVGWGNFSIFGSYNLTNVFKENEGPVITPAAVGICLSGL
jgi:hypothetical protein